MNVIIRNIITPPGAIQSGEITLESVNVDRDGSKLVYSFDLTAEQIETATDATVDASTVYTYAEKLAEYCDNMKTCTECPFGYLYTEDGTPRTRCRIGWPRSPEPMPAPERPAEA